MFEDVREKWLNKFSVPTYETRPSHRDFDPHQITKKDMNYIADHIEEYISMLLDVMVFPDDMSDKEIKEINEAFKRIYQLIRLLRKGKMKKIFIDLDEWDLVS